MNLRRTTLSALFLIALGSCSKQTLVVPKKINCILLSSIESEKRIDEYLTDLGMDGTVDLCLRCERDNYENSDAYLSSYLFERVRKIQGDSKLAYEIKHPDTGKTVQIFAQTHLIEPMMQKQIDFRYNSNFKVNK